MNGVELRFNNEDEFVASYDESINQPFKDAIKEASTENMFSNYMGVMIGNGEIWFDLNPESKKFEIIGINRVE